MTMMAYIGEEGTRQLVQALTVNTSIKLWLPRRCKEYASQRMKYDAVKTRISFLYIVELKQILCMFICNYYLSIIGIGKYMSV